jgi:hypothetical protein
MVALPPAALAQSRNRSDDGCNDGWGGGRQRRHCEVREYTLQGANPIDIDAGRNGGIKVRGWDRPEVHVTAKVQGYARTDADARRVAAGVRVEAAGTTVRAEGPDFRDDDENWSVSFEISAPRNVILTLNTENGGIALEGLRGKVNFRARNGGVSISDMSGGDIKGETTNGGVSVDLNGDHWDGAGLDVTTTNGGVKMNIPDNYSAVLHTGTVNGRVSIDFPVTIQGNITRQLTTTLGSGGAKISAVTTNGGVVIRKR